MASGTMAEFALRLASRARQVHVFGPKEGYSLHPTRPGDEFHCSAATPYGWAAESLDWASVQVVYHNLVHLEAGVWVCTVCGRRSDDMSSVVVEPLMD